MSSDKKNNQLNFANPINNIKQFHKDNMFHPPHDERIRIIEKNNLKLRQSCFRIMDKRKNISQCEKSHLFKRSISSPSSALFCPNTRNKMVGKISWRKQSGIFNPSVISLLIILYLLPRPSINNSFIITKSKSINTVGMITNLINHKERSLFGLAEASPAPEPAASRAKATSAGSHRIPPMNGSIFGKRSLDNTNRNQKSKDDNVNSNENKLEISNEEQTLNQIFKSTSNTKKQEKVDKQDDGVDANEMKNNKQANLIHYKVQLISDSVISKHRGSSAMSVPINYNDIITEIIEDFLASNNESDPEETSVAFCRMIVYECTKMLSRRNVAGKASGFNENRRLNKIRRKNAV